MSARGYMLRSARGDWRTPAEFIARVIGALGAIDLDPCAPAEPAVWFADVNLVGPTGSDADGLAAPWAAPGGRRVFVNPPFADLAAWTQKAAAEAAGGAEIIFLLPARTDTAYWHRDIATASLVCFLRGRLRFVGAPGPCPFPTALAYWGDRPALFHAAFAPLGMVVAP